MTQVDIDHEQEIFLWMCFGVLVVPIAAQFCKEYWMRRRWISRRMNQYDELIDVAGRRYQERLKLYSESSGVLQHPDEDRGESLSVGEAFPEDTMAAAASSSYGDP